MYDIVNFEEDNAYQFKGCLYLIVNNAIYKPNEIDLFTACQWNLGSIQI